MEIVFSKFQGTGNDFILLDNMNGEFSNLSLTQIQFLCNRKFGIGADGLIKLNASDHVDFEMEYFNSDGSKSFCGNGARCAVAFSKHRIFGQLKHRFEAIDGIHSYEWNGDLVSIEMKDVHQMTAQQSDYTVDTGSPQYVRFSEDISNDLTVSFGKEIRYSENFKDQGINVNLVRIENEHTISISTYERGVEDETLACGTGATACALVFAHKTGLMKGPVSVLTKGGKLQINFIKQSNEFSSIWLCGPVTFVFTGKIRME
jgi:diaminopimelate epimerase